MLTVLTLNVRGRSYLGLTRSISWLLMPWLLTSPGHQQPWYWLYRICRSFSYLRKCFEYLCQINVEEWPKMQIYVYVSSENFFMYRVNASSRLLYLTSGPFYPCPLRCHYSPLRQWCGWNSTQHQTWRSTVSGDFMACQLTTLSLFNTDLIRYADIVC